MVTTINRVQRNTDEAINRRIEAATGERIRRLARHPLAIERRLRELDREWDIRARAETNAALIALAGRCTGRAIRSAWLLLPALVTTFLFQHAVQGWCPPIPLLRRLGIRTSREIEIERVALEILRGDFADATRWANGRAIESDRALRAAKA